MEVLRISHENDLSAKNKEIQELKGDLVKYKDIHTIEELFNEDLTLNTLLLKQKQLFLQHISNIIPYLNTSEQLTNIIIDQRIEFNELNSKIFDHIEWQESDEGKRSNLPNISERHKDILFIDCDS